MKDIFSEKAGKIKVIDDLTARAKRDQKKKIKS